MPQGKVLDIFFLKLILLSNLIQSLNFKQAVQVVHGEYEWSRNTGNLAWKIAYSISLLSLISCAPQKHMLLQALSPFLL